MLLNVDIKYLLLLLASEPHSFIGLNPGSRYGIGIVSDVVDENSGKGPMYTYDLGSSKKLEGAESTLVDEIQR